MEAAAYLDSIINTPPLRRRQSTARGGRRSSTSRAAAAAKPAVRAKSIIDSDSEEELINLTSALGQEARLSGRKQLASPRPTVDVAALVGSNALCLRALVEGRAGWPESLVPRGRSFSTFS